VLNFLMIGAITGKPNPSWTSSPLDVGPNLGWDLELLILVGGAIVALFAALLIVQRLCDSRERIAEWSARRKRDATPPSGVVSSSSKGSSAAPSQ
jgi:hypothetical protein